LEAKQESDLRVAFFVSAFYRPQIWVRYYEREKSSG